MRAAVAIDLARVAEVAGGYVQGDAEFVVNALASLATAGADSLAFYADARKLDALAATAAGAVILREADAALFSRHKVIVSDPYLAYARVTALFAPRADDVGIHSTAVIAASATVHPAASVGAYCVVGAGVVVGAGARLGSHVSVGEACVIGENSVLAAGVRIGARCKIGARCNFSSGAVIGASGFGYVQDGAAWARIEHLGGVVIGDDVDVGANTCIDRGALDDTVIGDGVKLDNHIQIAHNVQVGEHTVMAGCVAIAGSAVIGKRCKLGGRAAILGHLQIADDVSINADSFVAGDILTPGVYSSMIPVQPAAKWRKTAARLRRLDELAERVKALEKVGGK